MKPPRLSRGYATAVAVIIFLSALPGCAAGAEGDGARAAGPVVRDIFGRELNDAGITLVDWEGHLANPTIKIILEPPPDAAFPATATLSSSEVRLYFDLPCDLGETGPRKEVAFKTKGDPREVLVSIWPDRDAEDEEHSLAVSFTDADGRTAAATVPVRVVDQDSEREPVFRIILDYSHDKTGFFRDKKKRQLVEQAAADWAYFIDEMNLDEVPAGAEKTWIWSPQGFKRGGVVKNSASYPGVLLYAYGIHTRDLRSGGEPSREGDPQRSARKKLPLKRSGGLEIETEGNFNDIGWMVSLDEDDWWRATNRREVKNDLYSISHHEMGHSLFFNPNHASFSKMKSKRKLVDKRVRAYHGSDPKIDRYDHFPGSLDRASRKGIFGYEYYGDVPRCRWIITKLDLLNAQALGYRLRETSAFRELAVETEELPAGEAGRKYSGALEATGGVPFYCWEVTEGKLPRGLILDSFTGEISGTPRRAGVFEFTVRVREYDEDAPAASREVRIEIAKR